MTGKPEPELINTLLGYDPANGNLIWRKSPSPFARITIGAAAGVVRKDTGYRVVTLFGQQYRATHLIWVIQTGAWPAGDIDHKDTYGPRADWGDRWDNLREATDSQNSMNRRILKQNTSGIPGVVWHARDERWQAQIWKDKKAIHLGQFVNKEDAIAARLAAEEALFGEFRANHT